MDSRMHIFIHFHLCLINVQHLDCRKIYKNDNNEWSASAHGVGRLQGVFAERLPRNQWLYRHKLQVHTINVCNYIFT